jgi:conjugal transfer pilus assembly protein TraB
VSAERAYIRTESLSCVTRDGTAIDVPIRGYVAGEDGKAGMRGRLVSKQGQILANALLAGVASGIGTAFQQSANTVSVSPLGTTGTVDPGKQLQAGLGTGVGRALDRLAQYYITLAEKVFPVTALEDCLNEMAKLEMRSRKTPATVAPQKRRVRRGGPPSLD